MSYTPQYTKPYANGYVDRPSKETPERASFINARDDTLIRIEKYLSTLNFDGKYALLTEAGYSLELSIDEYYVLTISLKNKAGTVISGKQIDLPIESMIVNVDYDEESGILTFSLQNGQTLDVNISTLVRGLVPTSRKIAGVDLEDDITAEELKEALGMYDEGLTAGTLKPYLHLSEETLIGVYKGKPLYEIVVDYGTMPSQNNQEIEHGIANVDNIWIHDGYCINSNNQYRVPIIMASPDDVKYSFYFGVSSTHINCAVGSDRSYYTASLILRYTKTTDLEGSGNNLNPYGIYDAKLDDVKSSIASVSDEVDAVENKLTAYPFGDVNVLSTEEEIDNYYDTVGTNNFGLNTHYTRVVQHAVSHSILGGGNFFLEGFVVNSNVEWQKLTMYSNAGETIKFERSKINGPWSDWVSTSFKSDIDAINSRLAYKDISSSINVGETGCTALGYVENGQVCINIRVPQGSSSNILSQIHVATNYAPRNTTGGYLTIIGTGYDLGKLSGTIMADGAVSIFVINALDASEIISFTYPLKSS